MKRLLLVIFLLSFSLLSWSQIGYRTIDTTAFQHNYLTGYFSYIGAQVVSNAYYSGPDHHEFTYRLEVAHRFGNYIVLGLDGRYIRTNFAQGPIKRDFYMTGITGKYIPYQSRVVQFFLQTGLATGNYCDCDDELTPYQQDGLWYMGYGAGMYGKLGERIFMEAGLLAYRPVTDVPAPSPYVQYIAGVGYNF